jgi:hypothetical protein
MNIIRKLLAGAAILGMAFSVAATAEGAASASAVPVMYAAHNDGWHGYVKPGTIDFGNGGSPFITQLTWKSWGSGSAWGTGKLWTQKPGCSPSYKCAYSSRWVGLYLSTVRTHGSVKYYARMAAELFVSGKARWEVGWLRTYPGATVPMWQFPLVYPYL